jgi:hypothetical protein
MSQGLIRLHSLFREKSKKQSLFLFWKSSTQESLYNLWKDVFKDKPGFEDFETILKVLHKRKTKVDELWGTLRTEEQKYENLLLKNSELEKRIASSQEQVKTCCEKSVQVNFLQDSLLKKSHSELVKRSEQLNSKETQLNNLETLLNSKFDSLILREKQLHSKELSKKAFFEENLENCSKNSVFSIKSRIFESFEDDFWLQVAENQEISPQQLKKLKKFEEELIFKAEEIEKVSARLRDEAEWMEKREIELIEKEAAFFAFNERREMEFEGIFKDVKSFDEERKSIERKNVLKNRESQECGNEELWPVVVVDVHCDSLGYVKLILQELKEMQKKNFQNDLADDLLPSLIHFTETLIEKEESNFRVFQARSDYLETCRSEVTQLKQMLDLHSNLANLPSSSLQPLHHLSEIEILSLSELQSSMISKHSYEIQSKILEIDTERLSLLESDLLSQQQQLSKLSLSLEEKLHSVDSHLFEFKSILQLLSKTSSSGLPIFREEVSRIVREHEKNPEIVESLKLVMSLYLWLQNSYSLAQGKDLRRVKLAFYMMRVRVLMLNKGFIVAPVFFSTPNDCMWLEIFWLRDRHRYFNDFYNDPQLVQRTKQWFFKFIWKKMQFAFEVLQKSRNRVTSLAFYMLRNKVVADDKRKTLRLYQQLFEREGKNCWDVRRQINVKGFLRLLPVLNKFEWIWRFYLKIFLLRWKNFSERRENEFYKRTVFEFYSNMSELMIKEYKFKEECRVNQSVLRGKVMEAGKLLDKILL